MYEYQYNELINAGFRAIGITPTGFGNLYANYNVRYAWQQKDPESFADQYEADVP